ANSDLSNYRVVGIAIGGGAVYAALQPDQIARSTDGGSSWTRAELGLAINVQGIAHTGTAVLVATQFGGLFRSTDGSSYTSVASGDYFSVAFNPTLGAF